MTPAEIIKAHDALVERACKIADAEPFNEYVDCEFGQLTLKRDDPNTVVFEWYEYDYEGSGRRECEFPAALLTMSDDELGAWRAEQVRLREARDAKAREVHHAQQAEAEYRRYLELKAKYGPKG